MKKLLILLYALAVVALAVAAPILVVSKTPTLMWDAVTTMSDGSALPTGWVLSYNVVSRIVGGDGTVTTITNVSGISAALNLTSMWSVLDLGAQSVLTNGVNQIVSTVAWGSAATPPFTVLVGVPPSAPKNIRANP